MWRNKPMRCNKCGHEIKEGNNFCTKCGAKIKKKNSLYTNFEKSVNSNKKFILLITFVIIMICSVVFILLTQYNIKKNDNIIEQSDSNLKEEIKELKINNLKYNIELKENGNMDVVETWNIEIPNTNTLYKTFVLDNNKYKGISNVRVSEILKNGEEKEFVKIEKEMYHVEKNCYYALINSSNQLQIKSYLIKCKK